MSKKQEKINTVCIILFSLVCFNSLGLAKSNETSTYVYDRFRILFGNVSTLQPYDMDQITTQILSQVNCTGYFGTDCLNVICVFKIKFSSSTLFC
jgi:hypothetical protein